MNTRPRKESLADKARRLLEIDPYNLPEQWEEQPVMMLDFGEQAAKAAREVRRSKANLDLVRAEMAQRIRRRPLKFGLKRVTEAGVAEAVLLTPQFQVANEEYITAQYRHDFYSSCVRACEHRKKSLEWESQFQQMGWYGTPQNGEARRTKRDAAFGSPKRRRENK